MASCSRGIKNLTTTSGAIKKTKNNDTNGREDKRNQGKCSTHEGEKNYTAKLFRKLTCLRPIKKKQCEFWYFLVVLQRILFFWGVMLYHRVTRPQHFEKNPLPSPCHAGSHNRRRESSKRNNSQHKTPASIRSPAPTFLWLPLNTSVIPDYRTNN